MKKKIFICLLAIFMCFTLVGCTKENTSDGDYQGATKGAGDSLENITDKNYKKVAKTVFGIELDDETGWTLSKAESPNKVNNLNIDYTVSDGINGKTIIEKYFNKTLELSGDGIYSYGMNESYTAMVKKDKYESFDAFAEKNLTSITDYYQAMWIYDNGEKTVLFSINVDSKTAGISFTLLS